MASFALPTHDLSKLTPQEVEQLLKRPRIDFTSVFGIVQPIVDAVQKRGDDAVRDYTAKFDGVSQNDAPCVLVSSLPEPVLLPHIKAAFDVAFDNIKVGWGGRRWWFKAACIEGPFLLCIARTRTQAPI